MSFGKIILLLIAIVSVTADRTGLDYLECSCFETKGIIWGPECELISEEHRVCMQKTPESKTLGACVHKKFISWQNTCQLVKGFDTLANYWEFSKHK